MKQRSLAIGIWMALTLLIGTALVVSLLWLWRGRMEWLEALAVAGVCSWLLVLVWRQIRAQRHRGQAVLLCRRFGTAEDAVARRNQWIETALMDACRNLGIVVTLRDASIDAPRTLKDTLRPLASTTTLVLGVAGMALIAKLLAIDLSWPVPAVVLVLVVIWISILFAQSRLQEWLIAAIGSVRGSPVEEAAGLRKIIDARNMRTQLLVVQSTDEQWQEHIESLLHEVSAVVVDVTLGTGNIQWEIDRSIEILGPERILFIHETVGEEVLSCERTSAPGGGGSTSTGPFVLRYGSAWKAGRTSHSGEPWMRTRAAARAVRAWLVDGHPTTTGAWAIDEKSLARARLRVPDVYAVAAALCAMAILAPLVDFDANPWVGAGLIVMAGVSAGIVGRLRARATVASTVPTRTPLKAAGRGATVAVATLWTILPAIVIAWAAYGVYSKAGTTTAVSDIILDAGGGIISTLLVLGIPLSAVVSIVGALIGVGVEATLFGVRGR